MYAYFVSELCILKSLVVSKKKSLHRILGLSIKDNSVILTFF